MKKILLSAIAVIAALASCSKMETAVPELAPAGEDRFTASFQEISGPDTRIYLDSQGHMCWDSSNLGGELISIFSGNTHSLYTATEIPYSNYSRPSYAVFSKVEGYDQETGLNLDRHYAVYPYNEGASLAADGTLSTTVTGAYHFAAVTKDKADHMLYFKNLCGFIYLTVKGYGQVSGIRFYGNNGESLRGPAKVKLAYGEDPVLTMEPGGSTELSSSFSSPIDVADGGFTMRIALPPITFTKGFTVEVVSATGELVTFTTEIERSIARNEFYEMDPVEVQFNPYLAWESLEDAQAALDELYADLGRPSFLGYERPDDFSFLSDMFSNDVEGSDLILPDSGYNWFSVCSALIRHNEYRNPYIRFYSPWHIIEKATAIIAGFEGELSGQAAYIVGQARALRAYAYLALANDVQFGPSVAANLPCVPILDESVLDKHQLPSSTVGEVYAFISADLRQARALLEGFVRSSAAQVDMNVACALSARASLLLGDWQAASDFADMAAAGFTPAGIKEVSVPSFMDISEHNWIWGYDMTPDVAYAFRYATTSSWVRSFSGWSYSAGTQCYSMINKILYDKIPSTDVRKGWWVDEDIYSPNLESVVWGAFAGDQIGPCVIAEGDDTVKFSFLPYTNVKFGCNPVGTIENAEDMPLVRVEEMILIKAECAARLGNEGEAAAILNDFVGAYRDPEYDCQASGRSILDEIWFQRRVELWGEGFGRGDIIRFGKPLVRFIPDRASNVAEDFRFNVEAGDNVMLLTIPSVFLNDYPNVVPTCDPVSFPEPLSGSELRDGVTD